MFWLKFLDTVDHIFVLFVHRSVVVLTDGCFPLLEKQLTNQSFVCRIENGDVFHSEPEQLLP